MRYQLKMEDIKIVEDALFAQCWLAQLRCSVKKKGKIEEIVGKYGHESSC